MWSHTLVGRGGKDARCRSGFFVFFSFSLFSVLRATSLGNEGDRAVSQRIDHGVRKIFSGSGVGCARDVVVGVRGVVRLNVGPGHDRWMETKGRRAAAAAAAESR